jgi:hypothetical protein
MNSERKLFLNLTLFNRVNEFDVILNRVTPNRLSRLTSTWTLTIMSIQPVPPHLSAPKMSHIILIGVTLA